MVLAHWVGVVVCVVLGVLAAVAYNHTQPAVYEATATGYVSAGKTADTSTLRSINDALAKSKVDVLRRDRDQRQARRSRSIDDAKLPEPAHPEFAAPQPGR